VRKILEVLRGIGEVLCDGSVIAKLNYKLAAYQDTLEQSVPGQQKIEGYVFPTSFNEGCMLMQKRDGLTLILEDGRRLDFFLANAKGRIGTKGGLYKTE